MTDPRALGVSEAIVIWSGWGTTPSPAREEARLVAAVGSDRAEQLMPRIREVEDDFYASDARFVATDLKEMGDLAIADFQRRRRDVSDAAVQALAWCYTYDYK